MKILLINADNRTESVPAQAVQMMIQVCEDKGVEIDCIVLEGERSHPCTACGKCMKRRKCIFDGVNDVIERSEEYEALIVVGNVQYGKLNQETVSFLERLMRCANDRFAYTVCAGFLYARHGHTEEAYASLLKHFALANGIVVTDQRYGKITGEDDAEHITDVMNRVIAMVQLLSYAKENGIDMHEQAVMKITDYMR